LQGISGHFFCEIAILMTRSDNIRQDPESAPDSLEGAAKVPHQIHSTDLLGGRQEIEILHAGETYRLRKTRSGKLILTK